MKEPAIYAGSFDPVTYGHLDLIKRAAALFPRLIVAVARNLEKKSLFNLEERIIFLKESVRQIPNVEIETFTGLLVDYAARKKARILIRGLRAVSDFEYEFQMTLTNRKLAPEIETIFLMPSESYSYITSRVIKEIAFLGGEVSAFVPPKVVEAFRRLTGEPK